MRHSKKQKFDPMTKGKKQAIEIAFEGIQMLDLTKISKQLL